MYCSKMKEKLRSSVLHKLVIQWRIFGSLSNTYDKDFSKIVNYFLKSLHHRCSTSSWLQDFKFQLMFTKKVRNESKEQRHQGKKFVYHYDLLISSVSWLWLQDLLRNIEIFLFDEASTINPVKKIWLTASTR